MKELSLNILDIVNNSITAGSTQIDIVVDYNFSVNLLTLVITDNGCGMSQEFIAKVCDPFTTTRTTRKVGLGIPLFKLSALQSNGSFNITSKVGFGTTITATFEINNIDRMPMGDLASTISLLIQANQNINYLFTYRVNKQEFIFSTLEIKEMLGEVSIVQPEVTQFISNYILENINKTNGGYEIL
ncbi:MAG: ATP-binding protein [Clostridia bacterium]